MLLLYTRGILGLFKPKKLQHNQSFINEKIAENQSKKNSTYPNKITEEISQTKQAYHLERRFIL